MREMVEPDGQCVGGHVGRKIGVGLKDLPQERAGIVAAAGQMLAQQRGHAGFGAIGDHLERIDEVLPLGSQASEPVLFRQGLHLKVMRRALAKLFELVDLQVQSLNFLSQLSLALLKSMELGVGGVFG